MTEVLEEVVGSLHATVAYAGLGLWKHTLAINKFTVPLVITLRRTPLLMCEEACLTERNYLRAQSVAR